MPITIIIIINIITINLNYVLAFITLLITTLFTTLITLLISVLTCPKLWIWFKLFLLLRLIVDVKFSCSRRVAKLLSQNYETNILKELESTPSTKIWDFL